MSESETSRLHVVLKGRVQGVGFRYFVRDNARALEIRGWVRNRWDGSVEVLAEGERPALDKLLTALRRGPRGAMVTGVKPEWQTATGEFNDFRVLLTSI